MNFKILRVTHSAHYKDAVDGFYSKFPDFDSLSFNEKVKTLYSEALFYSNSFSEAMRKTGNDSYEISFDFASLQKSWADENNVKYTDKTWKTDILFAQINHIKPDIIYFQAIYPFDESMDLKKQFPFLKIIAAFSGSIQPLMLTIKGLDVIFGGIPRITEYYKNNGLNAKLVYHGFDSAIVDLLDKSDSLKLHDFTFIGSSGYGYGYGLIHIPRYRLLFKLLKSTNLNAWLCEYDKLLGIDDPNTSSKAGYIDKLLSSLELDFRKRITVFDFKRLKLLESILRHDNKAVRLYNDVAEMLESIINKADTPESEKLPEYPLRLLFPGQCFPSLFGVDMFKKMHSSRVTLNCHPPLAEGEVGNMRMFEATGAGACLLTDDGTNMKDLFEDGKELVTYKNADDCIEKVNYLLSHENERKQIADAGQRRTLKDHTIENRCKEINTYLQEILKKVN